MTAADETPDQPTVCPNATCGATRTECDRDPCTRQECGLRGDAQPDMGYASPSDLASVARASNAPAVTELVPDAQPDDCAHSDPLAVMADTGRRKCYDCGEMVARPPAAPVPDGGAGGADVYEAAAQQYALGPHRTGLASDPKFRALVDGIRAPLLAEVERLTRVNADLRESIGARAIDDAHAERDEIAAELAEAIRERDELAHGMAAWVGERMAPVIRERDEARTELADLIELAGSGETRAEMQAHIAQIDGGAG